MQALNEKYCLLYFPRQTVGFIMNDVIYVIPITAVIDLKWFVYSPYASIFVFLGYYEQWTSVVNLHTFLGYSLSGRIKEGNKTL